MRLIPPYLIPGISDGYCKEDMACTSSEFSSMACLSSLIPQTGISYQKFKFFPMSSNVTKIDEFSTNIGAVWLKLLNWNFFFCSSFIFYLVHWQTVIFLEEKIMLFCQRMERRKVLPTARVKLQSSNASRMIFLLSICLHSAVLKNFD